MKTDRELLELAAKATGGAVHQFEGKGPLFLFDSDGCTSGVWNPLEDDGAALRLAVKLSLLVMPYPLDNAVRVTRLDQPDTIVSFGEPPAPNRATRRAIVRAAAAIGETL